MLYTAMSVSAVLQSESAIYIHLPSFSDLLPIWVITDLRIKFPVLYCKFSLVIYFISRCAYMPIPASQFIPVAFAFWCPYVYSLCLYFCFANKIAYAVFLDYTCVC